MILFIECAAKNHLLQPHVSYSFCMKDTIKNRLQKVADSLDVFYMTILALLILASLTMLIVAAIA